MACIFCRSTAHDYRACPMAYRAAQRLPVKKEYFGKAPNVFIGKYGYPHVRVGVLGTERYEGHDDPGKWSAENTPIQEIVRLRSELVNAYFPGQVKAHAGKLMDMTREVSLAKRPVDVEVKLKDAPRFRVTYHQHAAPHGPNVPLTQGMTTENVPIDTRVDKAVSATDMRASEAVHGLLGKGVDPYYLQKAFSMGNFGIPMDRKLVPTRWSITAVDDILGKKHIDALKKHNPSDCIAYFGGHLGNYYLIMLFDDVWQYELFEHHLGSAQSWTDYEPNAGRKEYAKETAGGYYAARVGIAEHLLAKRRQASVLAVRIITDEYTAPLGVWVVREAVRKALATQPLRFADRGLMLMYGCELLKRKFSFDLDGVLKKSLLVKELTGQQRLTRFS